MKVVYDKKSLFSTNISLHRVLSTVRPSDVINRMPPDCSKLVTLIAVYSTRVKRALSYYYDHLLPRNAM